LAEIGAVRVVRRHLKQLGSGKLVGCDRAKGEE
jgi:hypothetical protein